MSLEEFVHKSEILKGHCEDVGTDFDAIVRSSNFNVICEESEAQVEDRIGWIKDHYRPFVTEERLERIEGMWREFAGTPEQLIEKLSPWVEAGMTYGIGYFLEAAYDTAGLERFAREVMPAFA